MKKIFFIILIPLLVILSTPRSLFANDAMTDERDSQEESLIIKEEEMNEEPEVVVEVDSFELFWPIVAGKTRGDSLYFLKRLKEKVRGLLIFGNAKDVEYEVFLSTKRVVEAEALIINDEHELAIKTIEDARKSVAEALDEWEDVENKDVLGKHEINQKLDNLEIFLPFLSGLTSNEGLTKEIDSLNQLVSELNSEV